MAIKNEEVLVVISATTLQRLNSELERMKLSVPESGLRDFKFHVPEDVVYLDISASYRSVKVSKFIEKSYSQSNSYIQLSVMGQQTIRRNDKINVIVDSTMPLSLTVYQVISQNGILLSGVVDGKNKQQVSFPVTIKSAMAPFVTIFVETITANGELVVDSRGLGLPDVFSERIDINTDSTQVEPGDDITFNLKADPDSLIFLQATDQKTLMSDNVISDAVVKIQTWAQRGGFDVSDTLQRSGFVFLTDASVYSHQSAPEYPPEVGAEMLQYPDNYIVDYFTRYFDDNWVLWDSVEINTAGEATLISKAPDVVTPLFVSAYVKHPNREFALTSFKEIRVFKPFLVKLIFAESVLLGEHLGIEVAIFSQIDEEQTVTVTLLGSDSNYEHILTNCEDSERWSGENQTRSATVKAREVKSVYFPIAPSRQGHMDIVVRVESGPISSYAKKRLTVEVKGHPLEVNHVLLINSSSQLHMSQELPINLPKISIVADTVTTRITVSRDIMGPSISGFDQLLNLPIGTGEPYFLSLASSAFVIDYLEARGERTGEIRNKAISIMEKGYQRVLTFQGDDGGFHTHRAHPNNPRRGEEKSNMWFTTYATRILPMVSRHIFVDKKVTRKAVDWMLKQQNLTSGIFSEPGETLINRMSIRIKDGVTLTTFALISLYENQDLYNEYECGPEHYFCQRRKALKLVEDKVDASEDVYFLALALYALQLAGSEKYASALQKLNNLVIDDGDLRYWTVPTERYGSPGTWNDPNRADAINTEVVSYILLALSRKGDAASGQGIAQWLIRRRNPYGGFSSTQDTVVALQALYEYAKLTHSATSAGLSDLSVKLSGQSASPKVFEFDLQNTDFIQVQTDFVPSSFQVQGNGMGLVVAEVAVFFKVQEEVRNMSYELEREQRLDIPGFSFSVIQNDVRRPESGMVVLEVDIPSGWDLMEHFSSDTNIRAVQIQGRKAVFFYANTRIQNGVGFLRKSIHKVTKKNSLVAYVYEYYEPTNLGALQFYFRYFPASDSICDVCPECKL